MKLIKISDPGWIKEFDTEEELKAELFAHICKLCRTGSEEWFEVNGEPTSEYFDAVTEYSTLDEMLWSSCGCEFCVELDDE